jgi:L-ribulokinase
MAERQYVLGIDFWTDEVRAVLVRLSDGAEVASSTQPYEHGVMSETLAFTGTRLPPDTALQDPDDHLAAMVEAVRRTVSRAGLSADDVVGLGIDATACTLVLTDRNLAPLTRSTRWRSHPMAYARLWKHHAAQSCADEITTAAANESFLPKYGGRISSEWLLPKMLETMRSARDVHDAAERVLEIQDWIVSTLVGHEVRAASVAGFKANHRAEDGGYPSAEFLDGIEDGFSSVLDKVGHDLLPPGSAAGTLTSEWAERLGLGTGTVVAVGNTDAHSAVLGSGVSRPGEMVAFMDASVCNLIVTDDFTAPRGIQGVVLDGIRPGRWGYEAGQAGVGDTFGWFAQHLASTDAADVAAISGRSVFEVLEEQAGALDPGESGLVVLDWVNGNRSVLIDSGLSGAIIGLTLATRPHHIYRALLEAAAFGQRIIIEAFENAGVSVKRFVACGSIPVKNPLLMQILADVTGKHVEVSSSAHSSALGAALHAAIAGGFTDWDDAASLATKDVTIYSPNPTRQAAYAPVFDLYRRLHDDLGVTHPEYMHELRALQAAAR